MLQRKEKFNKNYSLRKKLFKKFINATKHYIIIFAVLIVSGLCIVQKVSYNAMAQGPENIAYATTIKSNLAERSLQTRLEQQLSLFNDSIENTRMDLVESVYGYMSQYSKNPKMSAEHIVNECLRTNFDIPLLLSQARLESVFGSRTGGTKSCFGVISRRYSTYDESVTDYIKIMQKSYLKRSTPEQLIARGFYVEGSRKYKYASDPSYSKTINSFRTNIIKRTDIVPLYSTLVALMSKRDSVKEELSVLTNNRK